MIRLTTLRLTISHWLNESLSFILKHFKTTLSNMHYLKQKLFNFALNLLLLFKNTLYTSLYICISHHNICCVTCIFAIYVTNMFINSRVKLVYLMCTYSLMLDILSYNVKRFFIFSINVCKLY